MTVEQTELLSTIYNLVLHPGTRDWERTQLLVARDSLERGAHAKDVLAKLEAQLRPLALRNNLTPDVAECYLQLTGAANDIADVPLHAHAVAGQECAVFAGGCFWCMVEPFEERPGIVSVLSGYTGGHVEQPTYDQICGGYTGHVEAVEIIFDPELISYEELVAFYWQLTDPTDAFGQFQDRGSQYRPVIFVQDDRQRKIAEHSRQMLTESGRYLQPIVTEIKPAGKFWPAENYHQTFYKKQPQRYKKMKRARQQFLRYQNLRQRWFKR